jgi:hypothetical protein
MRKFFLATSVLAIMAGTAQADITVTATAGNWQTWTGKTDKTNVPICGVGTFDSTRSFMIKWLANGENKIHVHVLKQNWKIPADTEVRIEMKYDDDYTYSGDFVGKDNWVALHFESELIGKFMKEFRAAANLHVLFPNGSEKPWTLDMTGSRAMADVFACCIQKLAGKQPTQPFGKVQPAAPTTQPYGNGKAPLPSRPGDRGA